MKKLLEILRTNARASTKQIAARLGKPPRDVAAAIEKLEQSGVIRGYRAIIDPDRDPNSPPVLGIIQVRLIPQRDVGFDQIALRIARHPQVKTVYLISGGTDLVVMVEGQTLQEVADFVAAKLAPIDGVNGTNTHFLLRKYKEDGILLRGENDDVERLAVAP